MTVFTSAALTQPSPTLPYLPLIPLLCRGASSFRLFQQPLVPMVSAQDGSWLVHKPLQVRGGVCVSGWLVGCLGGWWERLVGS